MIALDGHSSSGKSTLAKDLSQVLDIPHVDSGAMYRAVTLYALRKNVDPSDSEKVIDLLSEIEIHLTMEDGICKTFLNKECVEEDIRKMPVSKSVSQIAAIPKVRRFLVAQQREMALHQSIVMDGRDIGTVVLPEADVKIFVTASIAVRTQRRFAELMDKGIDITLEEVEQNLTERDLIDSTRKDSPLKRAEDAHLLDTSELQRGAMVAKAIEIIHKASKGISH